MLYDTEPWAEERFDLGTGIGIMHQSVAHGIPPKSPVEYMPLLKKEDDESDKADPDRLRNEWTGFFNDAHKSVQG